MLIPIVPSPLKYKGRATIYKRRQVTPVYEEFSSRQTLSFQGISVSLQYTKYRIFTGIPGMYVVNESN